MALEIILRRHSVSKYRRDLHKKLIPDWCWCEAHAGLVVQVIIAMPFLAIISLVGAVVWLILLPVKCFCCPLGCAAQLLWSAVEWLLKAPFRALLWASGKPWKPEKPEELKQGSAKTKAGDGKKPDKDKTPPV